MCISGWVVGKAGRAATQASARGDAVQQGQPRHRCALRGVYKRIRLSGARGVSAEQRPRRRDGQGRGPRVVVQQARLRRGVNTCITRKRRKLWQVRSRFVSQTYCHRSHSQCACTRTSSHRPHPHLANTRPSTELIHMPPPASPGPSAPARCAARCCPPAAAPAPAAHAGCWRRR